MKKSRVLLITILACLVLIIVGGLFYWFRPDQTDKECKAVAESVDYPRSAIDFREVYNRIYEGCLKDKGLK